MPFKIKNINDRLNFFFQSYAPVVIVTEGTGKLVIPGKQNPAFIDVVTAKKLDFTATVNHK